MRLVGSGPLSWITQIISHFDAPDGVVSVILEYWFDLVCSHLKYLKKNDSYFIWCGRFSLDRRAVSFLAFRITKIDTFLYFYRVGDLGG